jgi:hypothetical protein
MLLVLSLESEVMLAPRPSATISVAPIADDLTLVNASPRSRLFLSV